MGFALQLGTVRYLGTFLPDPLDVPWPVVEYLAGQLGVADVSVAKRYAERLPTQHEHAREIRQVYGYRDLPPDAADRDAYVLCILEQLQRALRRRDIFADPSVRWADPRAQLLDGDGWDGVRGDVLTGLGLAETADRHLGEIVRELDAAWRLLADQMAEAGQDAHAIGAARHSP